MNLIIDEGNSLIKVAIFEKKQLIYFQSFEKNNFQSHFLQTIDLKDVTKCIIASVVHQQNEQFSFLNSLIDKVYFLSRDTPIPFINKYATSQTLGTDRIALMAGAVAKFPNKNVLVIDAGTCITFDLMT